MANTTQDLIRDAVNESLEEILDDIKYFTPLFLAEKFREMEREKQAEFFNCLASMIKAWRPLEWRLIFTDLTNEARHLINEMNDATKEQLND